MTRLREAIPTKAMLRMTEVLDHLRRAADICPECGQGLQDHAEGCFWPQAQDKADGDEIDAARAYQEQREEEVTA